MPRRAAAISSSATATSAWTSGSPRPADRCGIVRAAFATRGPRSRSRAATESSRALARMADLPVSLTCADYARVMPLAAGAVKPDGIALTMVLGSRGSWTARMDLLRRTVQDASVHGGEWSMAQYLYQIEKGGRRHVGLPVFPLRNFTARDLYVRRGGPIRRHEDLAGRRIGMYSYTASGSIWYRHFLRFLGVDPSAIPWCVGDVDAAWSVGMAQGLPP